MNRKQTLIKITYRDQEKLRFKSNYALSEQYKKCRLGPGTGPWTPDPLTPSGAGSAPLPLPRTPRENIRSNTDITEIKVNISNWEMKKI